MQLSRIITVVVDVLLITSVLRQERGHRDLQRVGAARRAGRFVFGLDVQVPPEQHAVHEPALEDELVEPVGQQDRDVEYSVPSQQDALFVERLFQDQADVFLAGKETARSLDLLVLTPEGHH